MTFAEILRRRARVDLSTYDEWKEFQEVGLNRAESISDYAFRMFENTDIDDLESLIWDMAKAALPRKEFESLSREDFYDLAVETKRGGLDELLMEIRTPMEWAYENALMPNRGDLELAFDRALDWFGRNFYVKSYWNVITVHEPIRGKKEWWPEGELPQITDGTIIGQFLHEIRIEHQSRGEGSFLVFTFGQAPVVKLLLNRLGPDDLDVYEHELSHDILNAEVDFVYAFFRELNKEMGSIEIENRVDFRASWSTMLKETDWTEGVKDQILEFLYQRRKKD